MYSVKVRIYGGDKKMNWCFICQSDKPNIDVFCSVALKNLKKILVNCSLITKNSKQIYLLHELCEFPNYIFVDEIFGGDIAGCGASGDDTLHCIVQLMNSNKVV